MTGVAPGAIPEIGRRVCGSAAELSGSATKHRGELQVNLCVTCQMTGKESSTLIMSSSLKGTPNLRREASRNCQIGDT